MHKLYINQVKKLESQIFIKNTTNYKESELDLTIYTIQMNLQEATEKLKIFQYIIISKLSKDAKDISKIISYWSLKDL